MGLTQHKDEAIDNWVTDETKREGKYEPFSDSVYAQVIGKIESLFGEKRALFLDLGCGSGAFSKRLAQRNFEVVAADLSSLMLAHALKFCGNDPNVHLARIEAEQLPFHNNTFDAVLCFALHHHFLLYEALVSEVSRVLKIGGWLCICDPNALNPHIFLLMHPYSPVRYSRLTANQKPINPFTLSAQYAKHGIFLEADFLSLSVRPREGVRKKGFWFHPVIYRYAGFVLNSIKEPWRYVPAIVCFNFVHLIMRFLPAKYRANYVFLYGQKQ